MVEHCDSRMFQRMIVVVVLIMGLVRSSDGYEDPCKTAIQIGNSKRSTKVDPGVCGDGFCDSFITNGQWYRLDESNSGLRMPESCVPVWSCGTYIPIWLKGAHPIDSDPVTLPVCAQLSHDGDCCQWTGNIGVKRCSDSSYEYYVYSLQRPPYCDMAYCAGSQEPCSNGGSWNDVIGNCTTNPYPPDVIPHLDQPRITETRPVKDDMGKDFTASKFSIKCRLTYTRRDVDDGARYAVDFKTLDGSTLYTKILKSTDPPEVDMSEDYLVGKIDQTVYCRVSRYWQSQFPRRNFKNSTERVFIGFEILDAKTKQLIDPNVLVKEGEKLYVTFRPTFPITTPGCYASPNSTCFPYYTFRIYTRNMYLSACTFRLGNNTENPTTPLSIVFSPIANLERNPRTGSFYVIPDNTAQTQTSIFNGYRSNICSVSIVERDWKSCSSWGDPHITTIYGYYFHSYVEGQFTFIKIPSRNIEVQVKQYMCGSTVSCNCGVFAREGNNILGINSCPSQPSTSYIRYYKDVNNPGGYITSTGSSAKIVLPSGMFINVDIYGNVITINLYVYGSDDEQYFGFCAKPSWDNTCSSTSCETYRVTGTATDLSLITEGYGSRACLNNIPFVPQCDCANGGSGSTSSCPMPDGTALYSMMNTCNVTLQWRKKRQASQPTSARPSLNGNNNQYSDVPWPTPNKKITREQAVNACNDALKRSSSYQLCIVTLRVNVSSFIEFCILDIQLTEDLDTPPRALPSQMEVLCREKISSLNDTSSMDDYRQQYQDQVCPKQCNFNGACVKGVCQCKQGYEGSDCSLTDGQQPLVKKLQSEFCDIRQITGGCGLAFIFATQVWNNKVKCKMAYLVKNSTTGKDEQQVSFDDSPLASLGTVVCHIPDSLANLDLTSDIKPCNIAVDISLSNNGKSYSDSVKFTVFDGDRTICTAKSCERKPNARCTADRNIAMASLLLVVFVIGELTRD